MKILESIGREEVLKYIEERLKILKEERLLYRSEDIAKNSGQIKELVIMREEIERS